MIIRNAQFVKSSSQFSECPTDKRLEYAFVGRSNVGKSSLINMLVQRKELAKTSGRPGKTTLINHFIINEEEGKPDTGWYLVDLPGYGFAASSRTNRRKWKSFTRDYLMDSETMAFLFVLIDCRHEPQKIDLDFIHWLADKGVPFGIAFTKTDKLSKNALQKNMAIYSKKLKETWENLPPIFLTYSAHKEGREEIIDFIDAANKELG
jgi:GTP-binding protein